MIESPLDELIPPDDATLAALARACAAAPLDETALLVYADRLEELDRPALASFARFRAAHLLFQRTAFDAITRSLGVPAHLFPLTELPPMDDETLEDRTIARLERRVLALEKALLPFARAAAEVDSAPTGADAPDLMGVRVRLGDCRRAHQLVKDVL